MRLTRIPNAFATPTRSCALLWGRWATRKMEQARRAEGVDALLQGAWARCRSIECPVPVSEGKRAPHRQALSGPVLPVINSADRLQAAQVTFLTPDRTRNLRGKEKKSIRKSYGLIKGGFIQLGDIDRDKRLIVGEGVESTLSAAQITGLPAVSAVTVGNMKEITPPPCSEVIIAADNDKVGEEAAEALAQRLASSGRVVRIVPPERPHGVDKYDWNEALRDGRKDGTDFAKLRDDILNVEPSEGTYEVQPLGMQAFMEFGVPRQFLLKPWLTTTGLVMIDAQPGHGKTWLALSAAYAVASGQPLMDWAIERRGRVLYVDGELPGELLQSLLRRSGPDAAPKANCKCCRVASSRCTGN